MKKKLLVMVMFLFFLLFWLSSLYLTVKLVSSMFLTSTSSSLSWVTIENVWDKVTDIAVWGEVWDKYREVNKDGDMTLWEQFASGIMTWDTILDYAVYLIKFMWQIVLLIFALLIIWSPIWILGLILVNKKSKNTMILSSKFMGIDVYSDKFDINSVKKSEIKLLEKCGFYKTFSSWRLVFLHIITLWLFSTIYMWLMYDDLPVINEKDFWAGRAIWFLFIPLFNLYWIFVFWLRLVNRVNFQYKIRGLISPVSKLLAIVMLVLNFIPYLNFVSIFLLKSILISQIQNAVNGLVSMK